jgi:hypothetical protein
MQSLEKLLTKQEWKTFQEIIKSDRKVDELLERAVRGRRTAMGAERGSLPELLDRLSDGLERRVVSNC